MDGADKSGSAGDICGAEESSCAGGIGGTVEALVALQAVA